VIERHVTFAVKNGGEQAFEAFFAGEYAPAMSLAPGFVRATLLREMDVPASYQMVIVFETAEEAAEWRASDAHKALSPRLKALFSQSQAVAYDVVAQRP
jgi:heme-degrading monooxygenase HmoA